MKRDLGTAAIEAGNTIISNGGGKDYRHFVCGSLHRPAQKSVAMKVTEEQPYRGALLIDNQKNNRSDGMTGPKKKPRLHSVKVISVHFTL